MSGQFAVVYSPNGLRQRPNFVQRPAHPPHGVVFNPSPYSFVWGAASFGGVGSPGFGYGADNAASSANAAGKTPAETLQQFAPVFQAVATAYVESTDPRVALGQVRARISNYQKMRVTSPYNVIPGKLWYDNEITKLLAREKALVEKVGLEHEGEDATRTWRALGQTGTGVGIVTGFAVIGLILALAARTSRR